MSVEIKLIRSFTLMVLASILIYSLEGSNESTSETSLYWEVDIRALVKIIELHQNKDNQTDIKLPEQSDVKFYQDQLVLAVVGLVQLCENKEQRTNMLATLHAIDLEFDVGAYVMFPDEYELALLNQFRDNPIQLQNPALSSFGAAVPPTFESEEPRSFSSIRHAAIERLARKEFPSTPSKN